MPHVSQLAPIGSTPKVMSALKQKLSRIDRFMRSCSARWPNKGKPKRQELQLPSWLFELGLILRCEGRSPCSNAKQCHWADSDQYGSASKLFPSIAKVSNFWKPTVPHRHVRGCALVVRLVSDALCRFDLPAPGDNHQSTGAPIAATRDTNAAR
jgi:hypothetical protein